MADANGPNLLVVGGDTKRLQWLTHHVTSHWPNAQVTTVPSEEAASLNRLIAERPPDAVILQADFADEAASDTVLAHLAQMLRVQPALYCILLAENGGEMSAVRALKIGAKDYLPLARISRDALLAAIGEACSKRRAAAQAAQALSRPIAATTDIEVPGYSIVKDIATSNFSPGFSGAQRAPAPQCRAQGHEPRRIAARTRRCRALPARIRDHFQHHASRHRGDLRFRLPGQPSVPGDGVLSLRRPARPSAQSA